MFKKISKVAIFLALSSSFLPVLHAQEVTDPALLNAFKEIQLLGPVLDGNLIQKTGNIFAQIHENTDKGQVEAVIDLAYGPDQKNLLDVYTSGNNNTLKPAVVFIHGGGLTGGDKDNSISDLMYANVATFFAKNDMVGINATYRLVPNITYPQGGEDMQAIVSWIRDNASIYGIDPNQIFFLCASAGCTHVSSLLFDQDMQFENDPDIAGAIMLSGAYQAGNIDYFGADVDLRNSRSAFSLAASYQGEEIPVFLLSAEYDPNGIEAGTAQLYAQLCQKWEACPRFTQARDHNHISINQHINTNDQRYTDQMLAFIKEVVSTD